MYCSVHLTSSELLLVTLLQQFTLKKGWICTVHMKRALVTIIRTYLWDEVWIKNGKRSRERRSGENGCSECGEI